MSEMPPIIVLGAGPAGIGAGLALGDDAIVLEGGSEPGGLCRTIELDGAVFDLGGHSFHTPHPEIRDLVFRALEMHVQPRQARCYFDGILIPYPFQAHFREAQYRGVGLRKCGSWEKSRNFQSHGSGSRRKE